MTPGLAFAEGSSTDRAWPNANLVGTLNANPVDIDAIEKVPFCRGFPSRKPRPYNFGGSEGVRQVKRTATLQADECAPRRPHGVCK
jgi:hypothetical protein